MNRWDCEHPGCKSTAIGVGSAVGLRAIGWFFKPGIGAGFALYCPLHRPDPVPCREVDNAGAPCTCCKAEEEAKSYQILTSRFHEMHGREPA